MWRALWAGEYLLKGLLPGLQGIHWEGMLPSMAPWPERLNAVRAARPEKAKRACYCYQGKRLCLYRSITQHRWQDLSLTEGLACPQSTLAGCLSSAFCVQCGVALHTTEHQTCILKSCRTVHW